jgi:hypothetical protein
MKAATTALLILGFGAAFVGPAAAFPEARCVQQCDRSYPTEGATPGSAQQFRQLQANAQCRERCPEATSRRGQ